MTQLLLDKSCGPMELFLNRRLAGSNSRLRTWVSPIGWYHSLKHVKYVSKFDGKWFMVSQFCWVSSSYVEIALIDRYS